MRPLCWQLLLNCLPLDKRSRPSCRVALRTDYWRLVDLHYAQLVSNLQSKERSQDTLRLARVNTPLDVSLANEECVENQEVRDGLPACPLYFQVLSSLRQIRLDLNRTRPVGFPVFSARRTRPALERLLAVFSARYPEIGYVQGQNDLLAIFFIVFTENVGDIDKVLILTSFVAFIIRCKRFLCRSRFPWKTCSK